MTETALDAAALRQAAPTAPALPDQPYVYRSRELTEPDWHRTPQVAKTGISYRQWRRGHAPAEQVRR
ncbi:hypothetical protein [Salinispora fenicalii]|uniref:hypothetical protein n=1 Tax=Salinispora fenicalii TaxID=1137263 RepID=UPI0003717725|nr:hypothetical protein [Salinispora fenicalii]